MYITYHSTYKFSLLPKEKVMSRSQSYCFLGIITICFFFCLLPLPNTFASPTRSLCRRDQRDALLELQKEFPIHSNDSFPVTTVSWNKSVDCCSWDGVTCECDAILGNVISLELISRSSDTNTSLKSSSGLFNLQHLRHLLLSDCRLQGEIPSSVGNLSHLIKLDLSRNQLVGEVPASIGNLNQLESILLWDNHLRGNIPTSFANLTKLSQLIFSENQFNGGEIVLANLTSVTFVDLSSNQFKSSIFAYLSELHNLEQFLGNENSFVGPFPLSLLMIISLDRIELGKNQFEGPIDFGNTSSSSKLITLDVSYNHLDGLIPESISKLVNLEGVDLSHNNFRGVPSSISRLVNLTYIDISYNKLEGQVPPLPCLRRSSRLCQIKLSHNSFSSFSKSMEVIDGASVLELNLGSNSLKGPFPQWICKLRHLSVLDLSNNHFTGSIPQCLKGSKFEELNLKNNNFSGSLPDLFINGCQLVSLDVSGNSFVGQLPKSLNNCMYMEFLNVKGNKIKDMFPFWLGSLRDLLVLVLRSNLFYGSVYNPPVYVGFPRMRIIDISNNNFVGSLPQDYFANWTTMSTASSYDDIPSRNYMKSDFSVYRSIDMVYKGVDTDLDHIFLDLRVIDFSGNRFSGHIPKSIGLLSELRLLNLSGNTFTSYIPSSLENNTKLETLDLSRNNLSGEIPRGLGKLSFLSNINFSYNRLEGLVPRSSQFGSQNCSSFLGNPGLYGLEEICGEMHNVHVPTSNQPEESLSEQEEPVLNWIAAAIAFGPGVFCGLVIGYIFTSYKHEWFTAS